MITPVWLDIVDVVDNKFVENEHIVKYAEDGESLAEAIEKFLANCEDVTQYDVSEETLFESCGYDTGAVFAAWVESNGKLNSIMYQWETC